MGSSAVDTPGGAAGAGAGASRETQCSPCAVNVDGEEIFPSFILAQPVQQEKVSGDVNWQPDSSFSRGDSSEWLGAPSHPARTGFNEPFIWLYSSWNTAPGRRGCPDLSITFPRNPASVHKGWGWGQVEQTLYMKNLLLFCRSPRLCLGDAFKLTFHQFFLHIFFKRVQEWRKQIIMLKINLLVLNQESPVITFCSRKEILFSWHCIKK